MKKIVTLVMLAMIGLSACLPVGTVNAQWAAKASFSGTARTGAVGFSIGTKGYIGTGYTSNYVKDFWEWNQSTNVWTQKADFPGTARSGAVGFSIGTKGYIGTGDATSDFYEWNQSSNTWTQKADYPGGTVENAVGFSIGTKGYIGTGTFGGQNFYEWDQSSNTWTQKANFPGVARYAAVGFSIGTKGYIGTGADVNTSNSLSDFYESGQSANTWTQKADCISGGRDYACGFSIGTNGYIGTGHDNSSGYTFGDFYKWVQSTNTWSSVSMSGFGTQEGWCAAFSIGLKGYVATGDNDNGNALQEFYELTTVAGIDEITTQSNLNIHPNPAFQGITIESPQSACGGAVIEITNIQGQLIKTLQQQTIKPI